MKFFFVREVGLIGERISATSQGMEGSGKVEYYRGGKGPRAILIGTAEYRQSTDERTYSTEKVLARIKSGEIQHGKLIWRVDWIGLSASYLTLWIYVALFYWWLKSPEPQPGLSPGDLESGYKPSRPGKGWSGLS